MKSRKGIFLTLLSLSIVLLVAILVKKSGITSERELSAEQFRVIRLNNLLADIKQNYLEMSLSTASHRALTSLSLYVSKKKSLFENFQEVFSNATITGNIEEDAGVVNLDTANGNNLMKGNTLSERIESLKELVKKSYGSDLSIKINSISILQASPWTVTPFMNVSISLIDSTSNWSINEVLVSTDLDIGGYPDPSFNYKFEGKYINHFLRSSVPLDKWDVNSLNEHIKNGTYVYWGDEKAPSFLMRFTDPAQSSKCCGISSLIDSKKLADAGFSSGIMSSIDYQFFSGLSCSEARLYSINSVKSDYNPLYLDSEYIGKYNLAVADTEEACPASPVTES